MWRQGIIEGTRVTVRELRRDEGDVLEAVMAGLSPHSRYLRFHAPVPTLSAGMRQILLDVDGRDRIAVVAEADVIGAGRAAPVGIARMSRDGGRPAEAEIAVSTVDAWHRRGIGRLLVTAVAEHARAVGVRRLTARVLGENRPAIALFRAVFPVCLTRRDADAVVLVALLGAGAGDWAVTTEDVFADLTDMAG
jgi:GNAT superfamily N-acetyltransferase